MIQIAEPVVGEPEWQALREPLSDGWLTQGPRVAAFERAFADRHRVGHALAVTSCTTGLHLALAALGVGPGDEVIVPAFTWVATANAVLYCGATPVFADVDKATYNVTADEVERRVTSRTRGVVPVHLFGLCADVDEIGEALPGHVAIVEDAACAVGAEYRGRPAGSLGGLGVFSFHPRKIITTGEGGMITTDDDGLASEVERLRNHGASVPEEVRHAGPQPYLLPEFDVLGFNSRMTDLQGAVGLAQLGRLDGLLEERRRWAAWYGSALGDVPWLRLPSPPDGYVHSWQSYVTVVSPDAPRPRNEVMRVLLEHGISTRPGTHAVTSLGHIRKSTGADPDRFPVATFLEAQTMAIPLHGRMTPDDFERVADAIRRI